MISAKLKNKFTEVIILWSKEIDISDGKLLDDGGFYSPNLLKIWDKVENNVGFNDEWKEVLVWSIFGILHSKSRKLFKKGIYKIHPQALGLIEVEKKFHRDLIDSVKKDSGLKDVLSEFEKDKKIHIK